MEIDEENEDWDFDFAVNEQKIPFGEIGRVFVCFQRPQDSYNSGIHIYIRLG